VYYATDAEDDRLLKKWLLLSERLTSVIVHKNGANYFLACAAAGSTFSNAHIRCCTRVLV
jgi:hypothetical protein